MPCNHTRGTTRCIWKQKGLQFPLAFCNFCNIIFLAWFFCFDKSLHTELHWHTKELTCLVCLFWLQRQWDGYPFIQIKTDLPCRDEVTSCSETAKRLLREQGASHDNKLNLETEDWSQRSYLDKLEFEKKAIHLICPGLFSLWISTNREAILDLD